MKALFQWVALLTLIFSLYASVTSLAQNAPGGDAGVAGAAASPGGAAPGGAAPGGRRGGGAGGGGHGATPPPDSHIIYQYDQTAQSTIQDREPGYKPSYWVYVDKQRTADEAKKLVEEMGLTKHVDEYKSRLYVIAPTDTKGYEAAADFAEFQNLMKTRRGSNQKIIAIGDGATFVNDVLAKHAYAIAGILTYGGTLAAGQKSDMPVPAYVHTSDTGVANLYIQANGATSKADDANYTAYTNPEANKGLQRVVVSKLGDDKETLAQAFQNAWNTVLSKNFRYYMSKIESYNPAFDPLVYTEPWELEPYVMYDELGINYKAIAEEMPGYGMSLRYEYLPKTAQNAAAKSVPLVVMLHGNGNDPRIQGESGGWPEVAAKHNLILTSIEWQGRGNYIALGEKGSFAVIDKLLEKYPQIDPSRVYLTGLSAGAMNSFNWGVNNVGRIAAVAGASAPFGSQALVDAVQRVKADGNYLPMYGIAGNRDQYKPLPVAQGARSYYQIVRGYALLNDITVPENPDLTLNEYFGLKLDNQAWSDLGGTRALIGTLSNKQGVMIKLVALDPYAHWNYKPAGADMWTFLSQYRRDLVTGKLIVTPVK